MDARLDMCVQKGFDMVELDNVDGYLNSTGFPLKAADQLYFNALLANDTHTPRSERAAEERQRADPRAAHATSTAR